MQYVKPEMEVQKLYIEDVICSSPNGVFDDDVNVENDSNAEGSWVKP